MPSDLSKNYTYLTKSKLVSRVRMNIIIVGAGTLARHIAMLFSKEEHNVTIIDEDQKQLDIVRTSIDVAIRHGSGIDWQLLDDLLDI